MFENARWISKKYDSYPEYNEPAPILRKVFTLDGSVKSVKLNICGLGQAEVYINNRKVTDDVLITPISKYDARVYYNVYDVTALLQNGKNVIAVMLGNGWYNYVTDNIVFRNAGWRHHPKMIAELNIGTANGDMQINSDTSWKTKLGPLVFNGTRAGEIYDARLEIPRFADASTADDDWDNAVIAKSPGGILEENIYTPIRVVKTLQSTMIGKNVYDIGQNISGWARIFVKGKRGAEIQLTFAERLRENGSLDNDEINRCNEDGFIHLDKYILKGEGEETWEPRFMYHGFRYVEVSGEFDEFRLEGRVLYNDFKTIGSFECSDDILNKIHTATVWATLTNFVSIPTDCPHREQNGWTGDVAISCEEALMNFDIANGYKKWLKDFKDVQRLNGQLPGIIPTPSWSYNWGSGPAWDAALILIPYQIYKYTGDKSAIAQMWENMKLYMKFIESMADDSIVEFGLGDWLAPKGTNGCPVSITDTAYFYVFARTMTECAEIMEEDGAGFAELSEIIREKFRAKFMTGGIMNHQSQTAQACAIYQGLVNADEMPAAVGKLLELLEEKNGHIDCGILGAKYIFSALSDHGHADVIYDMVTKPDMPSYAYWINNGMTTLCENWDMSESLNHHMFGEVDLWFYRHLAGIRPAKYGFDKVIIKPSFVPQLDWVRASHNGISAEWKRLSGGAIEVKVTLPNGVSGELHTGDEVVELRSGENSYIV
ncbi:MAG: glycoside hydrolase family 78 protein [Oscillospiraceae bacterium]|nr:glycoside hydrolase family 78 protein [Oscillospiraceae bacterium]